MSRKIPVMTFEDENEHELFEITVCYEDGGVMVKIPAKYNGKQTLRLSKAGRDYLSTHPEVNYGKIAGICFNATS